MDADTRLAEIRAREAAATKGTWGTYYDGAVYHLAADMLVKDPSSGWPIAQIPDGDDKTQAFNDATFIGRARDDVGFLLNLVAELEATLERYVGKEPTVADEMAYLHRCLNAVHDLCREADKDGNTSDGKFTPAAVMQAASGEREDAPDDRRRRLYLDGEGSVWIDGSVSPDGTRWIGYVHPSGGQSTHDEVRARTGELHEIGRTW